ncbi:hypothetical protein D3C83_288930 [compost metagenome]
MAACVSAVKSGKSVSAASAQPVRMIGLRPILSESQPKKMKPGVAIRSAAAM